MADAVRLRDLEPQFLKIEDPKTHRYVDRLGEADAVRFLCPKCFAANGGNVGTHGVICWRPHVPQDVTPNPGRWEMQGTGYDDLTLVAGSSSVLLTGGCAAHFYVRNGAIEMCET
jgi:hypothetical protein